MWAWLSKERVHWHLIHYMLKFPVLKKISKVNLSHETGITFKMRAFILILKCKASVTLESQEYRNALLKHLDHLGKKGSVK